MADTDPVRIVVEIIDNFSDELEELKRELDRIDATSVDVGVDVDDEGDIESVKSQMEALREIIDVIVDIEVVGEERAMAIKQILERDMRSTLHIDTDEDGAPGEFMRRIAESTEESLGLHGPQQGSLFGDFLARERGQQMTTMFRPMPRLPDLPGSADIGGGFDTDFGFGDTDFDVLRKVSKWSDESAEGFERLGRALLEHRPNIMLFWNILALLIPIMGALVGGAIGLAAALGAVGTAAAAIVGLGLLGWGDDAQSMMQNLQREARQLREALFGVFMPVGDTFQPIVEDWLAGAPNQLRALVDPLQRMVVFADDLEAMGAGFIDWITRVVNAMVALEGRATQVVMRFGQAVGNFAIEALSAMLIEAHRNQDAYTRLADVLIDAVVTLFNLFKAAAFVISQLKGITDALALLTSIISNKWLVAVLTGITTLVLLELALLGAGAALGILQAGLLSTAASIVSTYLPNVAAAISQTWAWVIAANSLAGALLRVAALTGVGLALAGAGMAIADTMEPPGTGAGAIPGGGQRTVGGDTFIQIQGDVRKREMDRLLDEVGPATRREMKVQASMGG